MPVGILGSLAICTVIYIIVCAVLTGMTNYTLLGTAKPVAPRWSPTRTWPG